MSDHFSLGDFEEMAKTNKAARLLKDRFDANDYSSFIKAIYNDLDYVLDNIIQNRELRQSDGEDRTTLDIMNLFNGLIGYSASHETKSGGHVDLIVKSDRLGYRWLAEAKRWTGAKKCYKGYMQLFSRYSTGTVTENQGCVIAYFYTDKVKTKFWRYKKYLENAGHVDFEITECAVNSFHFYSSHLHTGSGLKYIVKHVPVMLFFKPEDDG